MRRAFTLIEILVAVVIIFVLASLLFPVFQSVREKSYSATCQGNLRQIQLATQMYAADSSYPLWFNDHDPADPLPGSSPGVGWAVRLSPYIKNTSIFHCPSESTPASDDPNASLITGYPCFSDYGYNRELGGKSEQSTRNPSIIISFADSTPMPAWSYLGKMSEEDQAAYLYARHSRGVNFAFMDGHVKWLKPSSVRYGPGGTIWYSMG